MIDNGAVYTVVSDSILTLTSINPLYFGKDKVVVSGLKNGDILVSKPVPGAFDGMIVKAIKND